MVELRCWTYGLKTNIYTASNASCRTTIAGRTVFVSVVGLQTIEKRHPRFGNKAGGGFQEAANQLQVA